MGQVHIWRVSLRRGVAGRVAPFIYPLLLVAVLAGQACSKADSATTQSGAGPVGPAALANSAGNAEQLALQVLETLAAGDETGLRSLRVSKTEFCNYLWPELPSSRIPNVNCDWVWDQATLKSNAGLGEVLSGHRGKRYQLKFLRFGGGTDFYRTYKVHKDPQLTVTGPTGVTRQLRLFGSVLEMDEQFKLFSFVVD